MLNAGDSLLLGEFLRCISDETIFSLVESSEEKEILLNLYKNPISGIMPNIIADGSLNPKSFKIHDIQFERIIGRNVLLKQANKSKFLEKYKKWISEKGYLILGENIPSQGQRLSDLIDKNFLESEFRNSLKIAEEKIYKDPRNHLCNWSPNTLKEQLECNNWEIHSWEIKEFITPILIRKEQIEKWFPNQNEEDTQSSYSKNISSHFSTNQLRKLSEIFYQSIGGKVVNWKSNFVFMKLSKKNMP